MPDRGGPTVPRGPGARFGARRKTRGGPSRRVQVPQDASTLPCSVHLLRAVNPEYYGVTTLRRIEVVPTTSEAARNVPAMVTAAPPRPCESSHRSSSSRPRDYSKANLTHYWEVL